jgi:hypothetical protein
MTDVVGGSTYAFVVWDGHPLEDEVVKSLAHYRARSDELRARVDAHNAGHGIPAGHKKVVSYCGQSILEEESTHDVG